MRDDPAGGAWRPALLAGLAILLCALTPTALVPSPPSLTETLAARFPAIRARLASAVRFEGASWQLGPHRVSGLQPVLPSVAGPAPQATTRASGATGSEPVVDRVRVSFPSVATGAVLAEGEGVRVALAPSGAQAASAEVEGPAIAYRNVYPETDALHIVQPEWTEEYLHLRSASAPRRFEYEIQETAGATRVFLDNGQVRFLDASGKGLVILSPVVVDAIGRRSATAVRWTLDETRSRLTLDLDPAGLEYPLLVDPTWITTGSLTTARLEGISILLHSGKVLVMAGFALTQDTSELYDPATGVWAPAGSIGMGRASFAAVLLRDGRVLLTGGMPLSGGGTADCRFFDPATGTWSPAPSMNAAREHHSATLLADGRVLVAGGENPTNNPLASSEIFDPLTSTWTAVADNMEFPHRSHGAVLLTDGRVLVAGGVTLPGPSATKVSEVFDPIPGTWSRVGDLGVSRYDFSLTRLPNGQVLAAGGWGLGSAELFNPGTGLWTPTSSLAITRRSHSATLLPNGGVVVAGGVDFGSTRASTEIFNYATGTWTAGPSLAAARFGHASTMLPDGRLLVAGGWNTAALATAELLDVDVPTWTAATNMNTGRDESSLTLLKNGKALVVGGVNRNSAEVYDPGLGSWTNTANGLGARRWRHTATLLGDGKVLVAGTIDTIASGRTAELYDHDTNLWSATASMSIDRYWHTATLLPCGEVLVVGGQTVGSTILASAERYNPKTKKWRPTGGLTMGRWRHTATLLADGRVLVAGGWNGGRLASAELYDPVAETWGPASGPMTIGRYHHTATLLPSGRVLIAGGLTTSSAELFDAVTGTFAATGAPTSTLDSGASTTLLPNGRVLAVGGFGAPAASLVYDPAVGAWSAGPLVSPGRDDHAATLLLDGRVLIAGGSGGLGNATALFAVGRGENPAWRPAITTATDPFLRGAALDVTGSGFQGLGEGSSGLGYMHSATNYPLVQLRRLDNEQVRFLPVEPTVGWSGTSFRSTALTGFPNGPAIATVFTNGIPSVSRGVTVECPPPTIDVQPSSAGVCVGSTAVLAVTANAPASSCPSYQWRKNGIPLTEAPPFSGTTTPTLTVTGAGLADAGSYDVQVSLACSSTVATSASVTLSVGPPIGAVDASIAGPASVCTTCLGGITSETHAGGASVTHQWGYRTTSGGAITDIPFATSPTYALNGADFPAEANYFLVVKVTAACGGLVISDEVPVTVVNTPGPTDEVPFFTITSRDSRNVLEWVYPATFNKIRIRYTTGVPCVFPTDGDVSGTFLLDRIGTAGARDSFPHDPATNGTTYCYTLFVDTGGAVWSTGRTNSGKPFPTGGPLKWAFNSGLFSTTAPTVGGGGVIATNNANAVHAMSRGLGGGEWPAGWKPLMLGGAVQNRSPIVPITVNTSNPVVFLGAQDGSVYAVDGTIGAAAAAPWAGPAPLGGRVQAAPAGLFTAFGAAWSYLLVGTREATADNVFKALDPANGNLLGTFDNGGGPGNGIGIISSMAAVDYATSRVYFTSHARVGGSANTLWCLQLGPTPLVFTLAWARDDLGDIESAPVLRGGRVYVGSTNAGGTLYSIDAANGLALNDRSFVHGDGPVRGFVFPDRNSATGDLYFAGDTRVWGVTEIGSALENKFAAGIPLGLGAVPQTLLFHPGSHYVYVGGNDGWLYQIDTSLPTPTADYAVQLMASPLTLGAPSLDREYSLLHIGSESGVFFAVEVPVLGVLCTISCAGKPPGWPCSSFGANPCTETCVSSTAGSCTDGGGA